MSPVTMRVTVVSAAVGLALITALAMYFRRRKRRRNGAGYYLDLYEEPPNCALGVCGHGDGPVVAGDAAGVKAGIALTKHRQCTCKALKSSTPSGDTRASSESGSPYNLTLRRSGSIASVRSDTNSTSTVTARSIARDSHLNPTQLLDAGMECVQKARSLWLLAIDQLDDMDQADQESSPLRSQLQQLLDLSERMHNEGCGSGYLTQICTTAALDAALSEMDREYEQQHRRNKYSIADDSSSDLDSFVSALDMADLSDIEDQIETFQHLALYEAALVELGHGTVPCRALRTKMLHCETDTEFLAKLHCVRLAFMELFRDETIRDWFAVMGRQLFADLMVSADRDSDEFLAAYDRIILWVKNADNWQEMEDELRGRGVKLLTFYDIVIDFFLFDAFDDLESPPASLTAVLQNRWLSNGFKETALSTAVWSVLKAKRRMLRFPKGFIAHFYAISEHLSPMLAWGFLGPDGHLKDLCNYFKSQVLEYMWDVFSFQRVRYTTIDQLADDVMRLARERAAMATARLSSWPRT